MRDIAVIGMSCRLPAGLDDLDTLVGALRQRIVTAGPVPADRWDAARYFAADEHAKGKAYVDKGNFLIQDVRAMDAGFFDLPPRMAENLDPMQRLLLELVWEAFENAGLDLTAHAGRNVGVYVGGFMLDHMITLMQPSNRARHNANTAAGMMMTMLSNRLSHAFDLRGPSLSIDTACSSSLVAFSYACRDIWNGDCEMAVVGGANVMTRPEYPIGMSKGHFLSRDGQCKSFDARGDGYGRGEGGGVVVLKTLERALADGDTILATVAGTGVNSDGRTPGISMPSVAAQSQLIRDICERFSIDPGAVRYVECHGTGTAVGDPIEAESIGSVYGAGRTGDERVVLGSIKSNIGHLEAGAGIVGIIKAVLTLMHREAFELGNLQAPHPGIDFEALGVRLANTPLRLAADDEPLLVAVNSFGYGGTNAHAVLRSAPAVDVRANARAGVARPAGFPLMLPLSARHPDALRELAGRYARTLAVQPETLTDVLHSTALHRAHLSHRAVVLGTDIETIVQGLAALAAGEKHERVATGQQSAQGRPRPVFVFTGMGPQWWAMGQELYRDDPIYRAAADQADASFRRIAGFSILEEMLKPEAASHISETAYAQPANFVVQWGLAAMLRAAGVEPGAIVGHSVGEVAAAAVSGALSLDDALRVAYERSRLQARTARTGSMLAVGIGADAIAPMLARFEGRVEIAAVNGPGTITLAGDTAAIEALAAELSQHEIFNRVLNVEVPYHSHLMQPILDELHAALQPVVARVPRVPVVSTVSGRLVEGAAFGADYWPQNVRQPVAFMAAVQTLLDEGHAIFVEIGPHPVLASALRDCAKAHAADIRLVETLRRNEPERARVHRAVAQIYAHGATLDWHVLNGAGRFTPLPNYPWQREPLWAETERAAWQRMSPTTRPLLGCELYPAHDVWVNDLEHQNLAWLKDHVVSGTPIMPAAGYLETLLEAAATLHPQAPGWRITDLAIHAPLVLSTERAIDYVTACERVTQTASIRSVEGGRNGEGTLHLTARLAALSAAETTHIDLAASLQASNEVLDVETFYRELARIGLQYGPAFRSIETLRRAPGGGRLLGRIVRNDGLTGDGYRAHPAPLDACFQMLVGLLDERDCAWLPTGFGELRIDAEPLPPRFWCEVVRTSATPRRVEADLTLMDDTGRVLAAIRGMCVTASPVKLARVDQWGDAVKLQMLAYQWAELPAAAASLRTGAWLVVDDGAGCDIVEPVIAGLEALGATVKLRLDASDYVQLSDGQPALHADARARLETLLGASGPLAGAAFLHGLNAGAASDDPTATGALLLMQAVTRALAAAPATARARAYLVTRGAFAIVPEDGPVEPAQRALNGFARVAFNEIEGMRFSSIDLPHLPTRDDVDAASRELLTDAREDEVALRGGARFFSRLAHDPALTLPLEAKVSLSSGRALRVRAAGERDPEDTTVRLIETARPPLCAGAIELKVEAVALTNQALRASQGDTLDVPFVEVVATVSAIGEGVSDLHAGQRVYGFAPGTFATHVRGPRATFHLTSLDDSIDARALLVAGARAALAHCLVERADPLARSSALVMADPLGLAVAIELRLRGVQVTLVAPAGRREMSPNVTLATPLAIEAACANATLGRGFDLIAAPLDRWAAQFGWRMLAVGGALVDTAQEAGLVPLPGTASSVTRADLRVLTQRAQPFAAALARAASHAGSGALAAADCLALTLADLTARKLTLPEGDGSLIVRFDTGRADGATCTVLPAQVLETPAFDGEALYLVTGALGGFGQQTVEWLAASGARHLVLASRSAADTPARRAFVDGLKARGIDVECVVCDVSDAAEMRALFGVVTRSGRPLRGVFHAAASILDEPVVDMTPATLIATMRAKAESARLLHEHTRELPLEHFVLFSSVANLSGNSRQAAYASANGYLDGLAWKRRALGLPATSINWGAIADVGVIQRDEKLAQFMRYIGLRGMRSEEALGWLARALQRGVTQLGITLLTNWADWGRYETLGAQSPRYAALIAGDTQQDAGAHDVLRAELEALAPKERLPVLAGLVAALLAAQLETAPESIAIDRPIAELGVDSLMATELQVLLDRDLGIAVSVLEILDDLTVRTIADKTLAAYGWRDDSAREARHQAAI